MERKIISQKRIPNRVVMILVSECKLRSRVFIHARQTLEDKRTL